MMDQFGAILRGRRLFEQAAVSEAAQQIGISAKALGAIERGGEPGMGEFKRICAWMRIHPSVFFDGAAVPAEPAQRAAPAVDPHPVDGLEPLHADEDDEVLA